MKRKQIFHIHSIDGFTIARIPANSREDALREYIHDHSSACAIDFSGCDLRNVDFGKSHKAGWWQRCDFRKADLRGADFYRADLKGCDFRNANLRRADLRKAIISDCDFTGAQFLMEDGRMKIRGLTVPIIPNIHKQLWERVKKDPSRLQMNYWHASKDSDGFHDAWDNIRITEECETRAQRGSACNTTHCRAGWVIQLAGKKGYRLEMMLGPPAAAALIYIASGVTKIPNFYADNGPALRAIQRAAGE